MSQIILSISSEKLEIILNLVSILFLAIAVSFLSWIRKRVSENLNRTFVYLIIAVTGLILIKIPVILSDIGIVNSFTYDSFLVIPAFFFLLATISFYKSVARVQAPVHHRVHHRRHRR